jgi:hypothetical protein
MVITTTDGKLGRETSPLTTKHQVWGHLPPFFCAYTPEELFETPLELFETNPRGAACAGSVDCDVETLFETDLTLLGGNALKKHLLNILSCSIARYL